MTAEIGTSLPSCVQCASDASSQMSSSFGIARRCASVSRNRFIEASSRQTVAVQ
jgi:hypothetical protein